MNFDIFDCIHTIRLTINIFFWVRPLLQLILKPIKQGGRDAHLRTATHRAYLCIKCGRGRSAPPCRRVLCPTDRASCQVETRPAPPSMRRQDSPRPAANQLRNDPPR